MDNTVSIQTNFVIILITLICTICLFIMPVGLGNYSYNFIKLIILGSLGYAFYTNYTIADSMSDAERVYSYGLSVGLVALGVFIIMN